MASRVSSTGGVDAQPQPSHHETAHSAAAVQGRVRETLTGSRHARNNTPLVRQTTPQRDVHPGLSGLRFANYNQH